VCARTPVGLPDDPPDVPEPPPFEPPFGPPGELLLALGVVAGAELEPELTGVGVTVPDGGHGVVGGGGVQPQPVPVGVGLG